MKITIAICAVLISGALAAVAEDKPKAATESTDQKSDQRVSKIDGTVTKVEGSMAKLTRKEAALKADALVKATDEKWTKIHTYAEGENIERLKVYSDDSQKTEEFYYDNGKLILVFIEPSGAGKKGHHANAKGTKYYFADKGLFAVMADGKVNPLDDKTRAMGEKLQRESTAFLDAAK